MLQPEQYRDEREDANWISLYRVGGAAPLVALAMFLALYVALRR